MLADAGHCNRDLTDLETRGVDGYVAPGQGKQSARNLEKHPATGRWWTSWRRRRAGLYAQRKWLSEAPYGWIKHVLGFRRFSLRGLAKARCEWDLRVPGPQRQAPARADGSVRGAA